MDSESDYGEEIASPDENDEECKDDFKNGDDGMSVNKDEEGENAGDDSDLVKPATRVSPEPDGDASPDNPTVRSPSLTHSNISDAEDAKMDVDTSESKDGEELESTADPVADKTGSNEPSQMDAAGANVDDGNVDDSESERENEDKESSYHSSPPESPSPPRSPEEMFDKGIVQENLNHVNSNRSPKRPLEDRDGELDFEEELPERKEDVESIDEQFKQSEKAEGTKREAEAEDGEEEMEEGEEKKQSDKPDDADEDDGEVEDDDDLEEGEVKDGSAVRKVLQRPMCRFFAKGQCTWGTNCRFLHPGINDKGNYNMFAPPKPLVPSNGPGMIGPGFGWHGGGHRISPPFHGRAFAEPIPPPPPPAFEEPPFESAWERGLRHAKEILKKSSKRKEMEPDFEEKRMNLSLGGGDGSNEYEKENDYYSRSPYRSSADPYDPYGYDEPALDAYERQAHDYWRGGNYENFEVRYTRTDYDYRDHDRLRERERMDRARERDREREQIFRERERERDPRSRRDKFERPQHSPERNWRDERYIDPQVPTRARGDEWRDPWRRSTSPKRRNLSRSFSSHSSASYSSSRSSGSGSSSYTSRSRSSSGSSHSSYSSRSYTHSRSSHSKMVRHKAFGPGQGPVGAGMGVVVRKAKQPPVQPGRTQAPGKFPRPASEKRTTAAPVPPPTAPPVAPQLPAERKKAAEKLTPPKVVPRPRSLSSSGSESTGSRSRSRAEKSLGAWPQRKTHKSSHSGSSRSRSSSISSLESVSSKSSLSSKSSAESEPDVSSRGLPKKEEKPTKEKEKIKMHILDPGWKSSFERIKPSKMDAQASDLRVKSMVNAPRTSKDPLKQSGQKTQIKLTLLNKDKVAATQAIAAARKELNSETKKQKPQPPAPPQPVPAPIQEKEKIVEAPKQTKPASTPVVAGKKRTLQPSPKHETPADTTSNATTTQTQKASQASASRSSGAVSSKSAQPTPSAVAAQLKKNTTSSRREELLKQLKAVEDAIARKRAKLA